MKKLANLNLDILDEILQEDPDRLVDLIKDMPEGVKTADIPSEIETSKMDDDNFALILYHPSYGKIKKFATHNPEITEINTELFNRKKNELPDEIVKTAGHNLKAAAYQYGASKEACEFIDNMVNLTTVDEKAFAKKLASFNEETNPDRFALPKQNKFPIHNEVHILKAQEFFNKNANTLDIPSRKIYAENVKLAAEEFGMDVSKKIEKYAELDMKTHNDNMRYHIRARKRLVKEAKTKQAYDVLYSKIVDEGYTPVSLISAATLLEEMDKTAGISIQYGRILEDGALTIFSKKKEGEIKLASGDVLTRTELDNILTKEASKELLNDNIYVSLKTSKGLEIFNMLSNELQESLRDA